MTCAGASKAGRGGAAIAKLGLVSIAAFLVANCAGPQQGGRQLSQQQKREIGAFSDRKYGSASPRVVGLDESAPKGGGRQQIGRPYMIAGKRYVPREKPVGYTVTGAASWYGIAFHGRKTANGEIYDRNMISAAHPTMPLPSYARVTNLNNNTSIVVRVNDRGPYHGNRVIDLSERTAQMLEFKHLGTARVKVDYLGPASLAGSDDTRLVASLRRNGPATAPQLAGPTMVASAEPIASARPNQPLAFTARAEQPLSRAASANSGVITETRFVPAPNLPLPPERPFDLETIAGASQPVNAGALPSAGAVPAAGVVPTGGAIQPAFAPLPPRPPQARAVNLSFVEPSGMLTRFGTSMGLAAADVLVPPAGK